ncbi:sterol desaturase family protein [Flavicella marina]|uniref:sterol desaturase family protein n=1 Tax=Flavicella marina TaxID=1475951 RepID=UPI0012643082|nr:sterol desaturase family protein [Flavicella marina]
MSSIWGIFKDSFLGYWNYLVHEILNPSWDNYFYALIFISVVVWMLEIFFPWRKKQGIFRKDFWLDLFYMFFNFFIFNLIVFIALSSATEKLFLNFLSFFSLELTTLQLVNLNEYPLLLRLFLFFVITDFVQWGTHVLLHSTPWLWNFHKVHHSVKEMGFAAHLRYHWMETLVYRTTLYIPLAIIGGFQVDDVIFVHLIALTIGHLNHANVKLHYGPLKYILNNPEMHIWHHAKALPSDHSNGVNFGISLSIWDYFFKTNYQPKSGRDIELGFEGDENFPKDFVHQEMYPIKT